MLCGQNANFKILQQVVLQVISGVQAV